MATQQQAATPQKKTQVPELTLQNCIAIVSNALEKANKDGCFSLQESHILFQARTKLDTLVGFYVQQVAAQAQKGVQVPQTTVKQDSATANPSTEEASNGRRPK